KIGLQTVLLTVSMMEGSFILIIQARTAVILFRGFTIRNGSTGNGGGIFYYFSSPSILNCTISGNSATNGNGGGIGCLSSSPLITNCVILENIA
ncbi:hypothetical protein KKH65_05780, partial [bacterium]|nr:hypothetical protein [bacterium]